MARSMKAKILAHLHKLIARYGLEGVENWHSDGNAGAIHVQREGEIVTLFRIPIYFNPLSITVAIQREGEGYSFGSLHNGDNMPSADQRARSFPSLEYANTEMMGKFILAVEAELEKNGKADK